MIAVAVVRHSSTVSLSLPVKGTDHERIKRAHKRTWIDCNGFWSCWVSPSGRKKESIDIGIATSGSARRSSKTQFPSRIDAKKEKKKTTAVQLSRKLGLHHSTI
jgi:hypothetical protein